MRLIELFAGIGAQSTALKTLGIPHESIIAEIDPIAIKSYRAIHGDVENLGDVCNIGPLPKCDILTYSFPCQDLSIAGKMGGMLKDSNTRSSLLWEVGRILNETQEASGRDCLPDILIMENVGAILNKNNIKGFYQWISDLSDLGYMSSYAILNAKDYGIPQSRPRCFMVSTLNNRVFKFPSPIETDLRIGDYLETSPDKKYYLSDRAIKGYIRHAERHKNDSLAWSITPKEGFAKCITCKVDRHQGNFIEEPDGIRKLTPRECWRLQGQSDTAYDRVRALGLSDSQLYKLAGNSIAVPCLAEIFKGIFADSWIGQTTLSSWGAIA